ncbi:Hypothetical predicted protein, partial [Paramuricea clavata]
TRMLVQATIIKLNVLALGKVFGFRRSLTFPKSHSIDFRLLRKLPRSSHNLDNINLRLLACKSSCLSLSPWKQIDHQTLRKGNFRKRQKFSLRASKMFVKHAKTFATDAGRYVGANLKCFKDGAISSGANILRNCKLGPCKQQPNSISSKIVGVIYRDCLLHFRFSRILSDLFTVLEIVKFHNNRSRFSKAADDLQDIINEIAESYKRIGRYKLPLWSTDTGRKRATSFLDMTFRHVRHTFTVSGLLVDKEKLKPQMIRASIDMRIPNRLIKRSRCAQAPRVEDFEYHLHDCRIFTKLDLRQGYHQLALDPETRKIATFSTPWGNYRPRRLVFGAKSSQDVFDESMFRIFGDIPHCLNQRDDILLGGRDEKEHRKVLRAALQRAKDYEVIFGHTFTKDELKPSSEKVKAVKECEEPKSKEEVRSFLGMTGYLDNFIESYATIAAPLCQLTRKETKFRWGKQEENAFVKIKNSISKDTTMAYFDPKRQTILRTEESFNEGLAAALLQKTDKGMQPVHFVSRSMTETEKR